MKATIIHGWDGSPETNWFPWLKQKLEEKGFQVNVPSMPDTNHPKIDIWVNHLKKQNPEDIIIAHSIGTQTVLRYLEKEQNKKIKKVILVAPFVSLNLEGDTEQDKEIAKPWLETPINWEKIKQLNMEFICLFSDNDDCVPIDNEKVFKEKLGAKTIMLNNKGHFDGKEYPEILEQI